ncbi:hypothetical protein KIW84_042703 [Lathyrus oleraceus]|uniref:Uncharacterized protein n=1 Tax=Pisum sativum TaxID=3888 RepID=A0A9D4XBU4_PEA|nr:hypothetical protein KIW84_042703 [Pisum sativum]
MKLLIAFPCLITGIILKQHPKILHANEIKNKNPGPLTLDYKLFVGSHVTDIKVPRSHSQATSGSYSSGSKTTKEKILASGPYGESICYDILGLITENFINDESFKDDPHPSSKDEDIKEDKEKILHEDDKQDTSNQQPQDWAIAKDDLLYQILEDIKRGSLQAWEHGYRSMVWTLNMLIDRAERGVDFNITRYRDEGKMKIEKFDGVDFSFWKMQIEDYLYQKKLHQSLMETKPDSMKEDEWNLLDRQALGVIRLSLS